uniref:Uncharacterized protein n=1 Tax=Arundo donax TaxID=35708 RepID=A0A0A9B4H3_ARUDO
MIRCADRAGTR